jgi:hypothetical protein
VSAIITAVSERLDYLHLTVFEAGETTYEAMVFRRIKRGHRCLHRRQECPG